MDQNGSKWIKLDQIGFPRQSKNVTIKSCHIYRKDKMAILFLIFLDQICPKWIKLDQIGFPHQSKNVTKKVVTFTERIKMAVLFLIFFGSDLSKMDQT